jgi:hypothetical protein
MPPLSLLCLTVPGLGGLTVAGAWFQHLAAQRGNTARQDSASRGLPMRRMLLWRLCLLPVVVRRRGSLCSRSSFHHLLVRDWQCRCYVALGVEGRVCLLFANTWMHARMRARLLPCQGPHRALLISHLPSWLRALSPATAVLACTAQCPAGAMARHRWSALPCMAVAAAGGAAAAPHIVHAPLDTWQHTRCRAPFHSPLVVCAVTTGRLPACPLLMPFRGALHALAARSLLLGVWHVRACHIGRRGQSERELQVQLRGRACLVKCDRNAAPAWLLALCCVGWRGVEDLTVGEALGASAFAAGGRRMDSTVTCSWHSVCVAGLWPHACGSTTRITNSDAGDAHVHVRCCQSVRSVALRQTVCVALRNSHC